MSVHSFPEKARERESLRKAVASNEVLRVEHLGDVPRTDNGSGRKGGERGDRGGAIQWLLTAVGKSILRVL